ncbi:MAG: hypothetical protein PHU21_11855 [Elusimicrobia bacterium]|nr:hypothetical protein [Elusimicrobiota bacterium]
MRMTGRCKKAITVALLLLNLSGVRVVAVTRACEPSRSYFGPTVGFRALTKTVLRQDWKHHGSRSFGSRLSRRSSHDLEVVRRDKPVSPLAILPPVNITLGTERSRNRLVYAWKVPQERSPVSPPQLNSRK